MSCRELNTEVRFPRAEEEAERRAAEEEVALVVEALVQPMAARNKPCRASARAVEERVEAEGKALKSVSCADTAMEYVGTGGPRLRREGDPGSRYWDPTPGAEVAVFTASRGEYVRKAPAPFPPTPLAKALEEEVEVCCTPPLHRADVSVTVEVLAPTKEPRAWRNRGPMAV